MADYDKHLIKSLYPTTEEIADSISRCEAEAEQTEDKNKRKRLNDFKRVLLELKED